MSKPNSTKIIFLCAFPPGANLEIEGLGRYFGSLFKSAVYSDRNYDFVIATFPWHRRWASRVGGSSIFRVETHWPKGISGFVLLLWSLRSFDIDGIKRTIRLKLLNKQTLIYNIHLMSAGVLPISLESNFFARNSLPILRIAAKTTLFVSLRIFNREKHHFENIVSEGNQINLRSEKEISARKLFDVAVKKQFDCMVRRYAEENSILVSMNNRFEIKGSGMTVLLVPDVIPITHQNVFMANNSRWEALIADIKSACLNSKHWITFSNATETDANLVGVLPPNVNINVVPHASVPPGTAFQDFKTIGERGLSPQWIDYFWRAGQVKVSNQLFRYPSFNQNLDYMIYPTQYRPHKNVELLMDSWGEVIERFPTYKLVLTLNESKHPQLQQKVVELGLSNSILFLPNLSDPELLAWQARAKFVISISSIEGAMPFMVSESISVGVPFLIPALAVSAEILPKKLIDLSELRIETSEALTKSLLGAINQRDRIWVAQEEWSKSYSRSWNDVWRDWMRVIERVTEK